SCMRSLPGRRPLAGGIAYRTTSDCRSLEPVENLMYRMPGTTPSPRVRLAATLCAVAAVSGRIRDGADGGDPSGRTLYMRTGRSNAELTLSPTQRASVGVEW